MNRLGISSLIALLAISAAAACTTSARQGYVAGGEVDLSMATPAVLDAEEITVLGQMSDASILGHLMALDSIEVEMADTALRWVKGDDVNAYARLMNLTHSDDYKALRDLAGSSGLVPTVDVGKLGAKHVTAGMDSVRLTSSVTKDQLFIRSQIELHSHALAELQVLQGVARNAMLRQHITNMIPVVRDHLARAQAIAGPLGVSRRGRN